MMATVLEGINESRLENLKLACNYYLNFLYRTMQYNLVPRTSLEYSELSRYFIEDKDEDDVKEERFENWLKIVPRDFKIDRMKRIMKLKSYEIPLNDADREEDEEDNEIDNLIWNEIIEYYILLTVDRLGMLLREIELLELGQNLIEPIKRETKSTQSSTKIDKPFKLVKNRKQVSEGVFKSGHNLPTMTIDEYLDLERKRGNIVTGGGAASAVKKEIDEDDEEVIEIELRKSREFDEFKDSKRFILERL